VATQIAHALEFAECAESFLASGHEPTSPELGPEATSWATTGMTADHAVAPFRFLDLGSGGGLPGLVLAHHWPCSRAVLLDGSRRKAMALRKAVGECGWADRVNVVHSRAEVAARSELRGAFDLVVARSFGLPPTTAECAAPFLRSGGLLVVSEPPVDLPPDSNVAGCASDPDRWSPEGLVVVGLKPVTGWRRRFGYQVLRQFVPCPERFPRRVGVARKRPIYKVSSPDTGRDG
jgi:16S rRNA (guanine527-N7)-methyltransferase